MKFLGPKVVRAGFVRKYSSKERPFSTAIGVVENYYNDEVYEYKIEKVSVIPKEYNEIPGPKELPIIGNAWRFAPIIGEYFNFRILLIRLILIGIYNSIRIK